eukprot:Opistho-1_new@81257
MRRLQRAVSGPRPPRRLARLPAHGAGVCGFTRRRGLAAGARLLAQPLAGPNPDGRGRAGPGAGPAGDAGVAAGDQGLPRSAGDRQGRAFCAGAGRADCPPRRRFFQDVLIRQPEHRQMPAQKNRAQAQRHHHHHAGPEGQRGFEPQRLERQVKRDAGNRRRGVNVLAQQQRDLVAEDIAHHAAGHTGHGAHEHHDQRVQPCRLGELRAAQRKHGQAQRIGDQQRLRRDRQKLHIQHRAQRRGADQHQVGRIGHPEHRMPVHQHVAQRAAADGGQRGQHHHAEQVQLEPAGGQRAADRKHGDTEQVEKIKQHGAAFIPAARPRPANGILGAVKKTYLHLFPVQRRARQGRFQARRGAPESAGTRGRARRGGAGQPPAFCRRRRHPPGRHPPRCGQRR